MKEERELQRPRQVVLLSFQNLVFPTSYFRLEGRGKVKEDLEIPTDRERRTEKKVKVRKSLANQSKVNFLFSFPSYRLAAMQGQDQWEYKAHTQPLLSPYNLWLSTRQTVKGTETNNNETKLEAQKSQFASLVTGVVVGRQGTTGYSSSPPPTVASKLNLDSRRPDPSVPWRWW